MRISVLPPMSLCLTATWQRPWPWVPSIWSGDSTLDLKGGNWVGFWLCLFFFSCSVVFQLCNHMDCSMPHSSVLLYLPLFAQTQVHGVSDAISSSAAPFSACLQSFPASGFFSSESSLHIWCPNNLSFSISPSNTYSGLISFRINWFEMFCLNMLMET